MTSNELMKRAKKLLDALFKDPKKFAKQGKAYQLLQLYFKGLDKQTLIPMLRSADEYIVSAGTFICSELGSEAKELVAEVIPLLGNTYVEIRYESFEIVMVCSAYENPENFIHIVKALEDEEQIIRILAMKLLSNSTDQQISKAISNINTFLIANRNAHLEGLSLMLDTEKLIDEEIESLINSKDILLRKYGAVLARRKFASNPTLIKSSLNNEDEDVRKFSKDTLFVLED